MNRLYLKVRLLTLCLLCSTAHLSAQNTRGLHVNDFKYILGNEEKENELLHFAQMHGFNYLLLYNLNFIHQHLYDLSIAEDAAVLANFIKKAKQQYGIIEVGGVGEKYKSFIPQFIYNQRYADLPEQQIDVYSIEFEFWNTRKYESGGEYCNYYLLEAGLPCTNEGAFTFYLEQLQRIKDLAKEHDVKLETYIGLPTELQCKQIAGLLDRVLVHYYRGSDTYNDGRSIYNYNAYRIQALAEAKKQIDVVPLFNARPEFMGTWLADNGPEQAFVTFMFGREGFNQTEGNWKQYINISGFQWYRFTDAKVALDSVPFSPTTTSTAQLPTEDISDIVNLFPNPVDDLLNLTWEMDLKVHQIYISNILGKIIYQQPNNLQQGIRIPTRQFPKGILNVTLQTNKGIIQKKIMKH